VISTKTKVVCPVDAIVPDALAIKRVGGKPGILFSEKKNGREEMIFG
jgi:hypothetical protein